MKQQSLGIPGFEKYCKQTRKEIFLAQMDEILPWAALCDIIGFWNHRYAGWARRHFDKWYALAI